MFTKTEDEIKRAEVRWCKDIFFDPNGNLIEEETTHPYAIISPDCINRGTVNVTALMLTTNLSYGPMRTIINGYSKLEPSVIKAENIKTFPKAYVGDLICTLREPDMKNVERSIQVALGIIKADED